MKRKHERTHLLKPFKCFFRRFIYIFKASSCTILLKSVQNMMQNSSIRRWAIRLVKISWFLIFSWKELHIYFFAFPQENRFLISAQRKRVVIFNLPGNIYILRNQTLSHPAIMETAVLFIESQNLGTRASGWKSLFEF